MQAITNALPSMMLELLKPNQLSLSTVSGVLLLQIYLSYNWFFKVYRKEWNQNLPEWGKKKEDGGNKYFINLIEKEKRREIVSTVFHPIPISKSASYYLTFKRQRLETYLAKTREKITHMAQMGFDLVSISLVVCVVFFLFPLFLKICLKQSNTYLWYFSWAYF